MKEKKKAEAIKATESKWVSQVRCIIIFFRPTSADELQRGLGKEELPVRVGVLEKGGDIAEIPVQNTLACISE